MSICHAICDVDDQVPGLQNFVGGMLERAALQRQALDVVALRDHFLAGVVHGTGLRALLLAASLFADVLVVGGDFPRIVPALPYTVVAVVVFAGLLLLG